MMTAFPLDNTDYDAAQLGSYMATRGSGVYCADGNYEVTAGGDMTVTVSPGLAWALMSEAWGVSLYLDENTSLTIPTADGVLSRIDNIVLRLDKVNNSAYPAVVKGIPGSSPTAPDPQRDSAAYELVIARVYVPAGTVEIAQANIVDTRLDETVCGLMRDGVTGIPTAQLYAEARSKMEGLTDKFDAWFATAQGILSEDAAGNLLELIQQNEEDTVAKLAMQETRLSRLLPRTLLFSLPSSGWTVCTSYDGAAYSGGDLWQQSTERAGVTALTCLTVLADNALARQLENDGATALWPETAEGSVTFYVRGAKLTADMAVGCLAQETEAPQESAEEEQG